MITIYENHIAPVITQYAQETDSSSESTKLVLPPHYKEQVEEIMELVRDQKVKLAREVERWCAERGV